MKTLQNCLSGCLVRHRTLLYTTNIKKSGFLVFTHKLLSMLKVCTLALIQSPQTPADWKFASLNKVLSLSTCAIGNWINGGHLRNFLLAKTNIAYASFDL